MGRFHVLAYSGSVGAGSTFVEIAALTDGLFAIASTNRFTFGADLMLIAAHVGGTSLNSARVSTPTLRPTALPVLRPLAAARTPGNNPNLVELLRHPIILRGAEEIAVEVFHDDAGSQTIDVLLFVTRGLVKAPAGEIVTLRGTSSTAVTGGSWQQISVTWEWTLPRGEYSVVGAEVNTAPGIAHRWSFDKGGFRPGGACGTTDEDRTHDYFYLGRLGEWERFRMPVLPRVEVLTTGASSSHTVYLQVVPIS